MWHCSGNLSGLIASSILNEWVISGRQVVMYWAPVVRLLCVCHTKHCHGKHADWNRPPWPGTIVTICMSCFVTGDPEKEYGISKPPPTGRVRERLKEDTACPSTSQNPSRWHPSWLSDTCATRKNSELEWLAKDHPETNPITIKPETTSHEAEQFSWVPLLFSTRVPFPNKISCFVSTCVSSDDSFPSVRQEPSFRPWKGSPFLQQHYEDQLGNVKILQSF